MLRSLNCGCFGVLPPTPQSHDPMGLLIGSMKRNSAKVGEIEDEILKEVKEFVMREVQIFPKCEPLEAEEWLKECNLPNYKKEEMKKDYQKYLENKNEYDQKMEDDEWNDLRTATIFGKAEHLTDVKPLRAINPTSSAFKYIVGPYFHWLDKWLFFNGPFADFFVKKIPVKDRPKAIKLRLGNEYKNTKTYSTDYSSFECSFTNKVMEHIEMVLYEHCFGHLPVWFYIRSLRGLKTKYNDFGVVMKHKHFLINTTSCRMSGEMNTSLGNGFSNWIFTKFCVNYISGSNLRGIFEGDDGLFRYEGEEFPVHLAGRCGFSLKIQPTIVNRASFCGNIFDLHKEVVIADPWYTLASTGFSFNAVGASTKTVNLLTAAKGISLMYQYSNCPVLPHFGRRMLRTSMINLKYTEQQIRQELSEYYLKSQKIDWWERRKMLECLRETLTIEVDHSTRLLMEQHFGFSIELQLYIEKELGNGEGWFLSEVLLHEYTNAHIKQLDNTIINYKTWLDNFNECFVSDRTLTRTGNMPSINQEFTDLIEIFNFVKYENFQNSDGINLPFRVHMF